MDTTYVMLVDADQTLRSSADYPVGWTKDREAALGFLREHGDNRVLVIESNTTSYARKGRHNHRSAMGHVGSLSRKDA